MHFTDLNIHTAGVGDYRLNRYRIHFDIPQERLDPTFTTLKGPPFEGHRVDELGDLIYKNFAAIINPRNIVHMEVKPQQWKGRDTFAFTLTGAPFGIDWLDYTAPDFHADWVGIEWQDPKIGFTVQTLRRNFFEPMDYVLIGTAGIGALGDSAIHGLNLGNQTVKSISSQASQLAAQGASINMQHVLAGRRSWRIGKAITFEPHRWAHAPHTYTLETAAIERLSDPLFQTIANTSLGSMSGYSQLQAWKIAGDFDIALKRVWVCYMNTFCRFLRFNIVRESTLTHYDDDVSWLQEDFPDRKSCEASTQFGLITALYRDIYPV